MKGRESCHGGKLSSPQCLGVVVPVAMGSRPHTERGQTYSAILVVKNAQGWAVTPPII